MCSIHDVYSKSWSGRRTLPLFDLIWRRADGLVAISEGVKAWLVRERGVPRDRISVIRYGIEPGSFARAESDLRARWGLVGRPVIGSIGRLEPRKGHDTLIRSMIEVVREIPDAALVIAGHDPWGHGATLQDLIDRLGLAHLVRLVGFQADVPSFIHALDVFAFASRSEGFGQVVIEVMDAGRPVVASRIPPITEIVEDGGTGVLVPVDDHSAFAAAVVRLLADPEARRRMGAQGQRRVREVFSAAGMVTRTTALYRSLLDART